MATFCAVEHWVMARKSESVEVLAELTEKNNKLNDFTRRTFTDAENAAVEPEISDGAKINAKGGGGTGHQ